VSLRIGFDLDGVLADMDSALLREAAAVFGEAAARQMQQRPESSELAASAVASSDESAEVSDGTTPPLIRLSMTPRQQRRLWHHVRSVEDFWQSLTEIESGSIARLAQLAHERRWEIIFLTKRPQTAGATAQVQSQRWLESKGFSLPSLFVVQGSRGRIASALSLDVVVDDRPENCFDVVADSNAKPILVWRDSPKALPTAAQRLGIGIVGSVEECLNLLAAADASSSEEASIFSRLKRLFGAKERPDG
jgi:hypothetical protein